MKMSQTSPDPATAGPGLVSHDYVEDLAAASHLEQGDPTRVASFFWDFINNTVHSVGIALSFLLRIVGEAPEISMRRGGH